MACFVRIYPPGHTSVILAVRSIYLVASRRSSGYKRSRMRLVQKQQVWTMDADSNDLFAAIREARTVLIEKLTAQRNNLSRYLYSKLLFVLDYIKTRFLTVVAAHNELFEIVLYRAEALRLDVTPSIPRPVAQVRKAVTVAEKIAKNPEVVDRMTPSQLYEYRRELRNGAVCKVDSVNNFLFDLMIADFG